MGSGSSPFELRWPWKERKVEKLGRAGRKTKDSISGAGTVGVRISSVQGAYHMSDAVSSWKSVQRFGLFIYCGECARPRTLRRVHEGEAGGCSRRYSR